MNVQANKLQQVTLVTHDLGLQHKT